MSHSFFPRVAKRPLGFKLAEAVTGHSFKIAEEWLVDRFIYTLVVGYFVNLYGAVLGGLYGLMVMFPVTAVLCYLYIWGYNKLQRDLFGFELLKELKDEVPANTFLRFLKWVAGLHPIFAFFVLSTQKDAFMTTVYLKKDAFKPMNGRDHKIFWASLFVSNVYWAVLITGLTSAVLWIIEFPAMLTVVESAQHALGYVWQALESMLLTALIAMGEAILWLIDGLHTNVFWCLKRDVFNQGVIYTYSALIVFNLWKIYKINKKR